MNIIYLLNTTSPSAGSSKSFAGLLKEVMKAGHKVKVIVPDENGVAITLRKNGIDVIALHYIFGMRPYSKTLKDKLIFPARYLRLKLLNYLASRRLDKIASEFKADIFHANSSVTEIGYLSAKRLGKPHISHVREYGMKDHHMHILGLHKRLYGKNNFNICITKDILKYQGLENSRNSCVIYNPIASMKDMRFFPNKEDYILYVGRLDPTKGIEDMIGGYIRYCQTSDKPMRLLLAGKYYNFRHIPMIERLKKELKDASLENMVEWLGERNDVADLMSKAKLVVVTSFFEAFGRVMPEAITNGALVAARDTGGSHEQFENGLAHSGGEIGLRFMDVNGLADCIGRAASMSEEEYYSFVERGQKTVKAFYSKEVSAKSVLDFYDKVLQMQKGQVVKSLINK